MPPLAPSPNPRPVVCAEDTDTREQRRSGTRPRVLLDVDGVLADFTSGLLRIVHEVTGRSYAPDHVTEYDFARALSLTPDEREVVNRVISTRAGFCSGLDVFDGAYDGVRRLRSVADVYVATSPWNSAPTWTHERERWLWAHFEIPHARVLHGSAKHLIAGDFLVDDKTSACRDWQAAHPNGVAVQWQTPHNRNDGWTGISTRSWDELCALVEGRLL